MSSFCIPSIEKMVILKGKLIEQFTVGSSTLIQSGTSPAPSLILSTEVSNDRTVPVPRETQNHTWQLTRSCVYQLNILTNTCIIVISITLERNWQLSIESSAARNNKIPHWACCSIYTNSSLQYRPFNYHVLPNPLHHCHHQYHRTLQYHHHIYHVGQDSVPTDSCHTHPQQRQNPCLFGLHLW